MVIKNFPLLRGEVLKFLSLKNWNYTDLAKKTGYSPAYIRALMSGSHTSKTALKKIVSVLDLPNTLAK